MIPCCCNRVQLLRPNKYCSFWLSLNNTSTICISAYSCIITIIRLYLTISWLGLQSVRFRSPH
nr:MAG TPA: hypothetical protein [Caudoviricetes sp.]